MVFLRKKTLSPYLRAELATSFMDHHYDLKEQLADNYDYSGLGILQTFFFQKMKKILLFHNKQLTIFDANKKFKFSNRNKDFGKFLFPTMSLTASQYLKILR